MGQCDLPSVGISRYNADDLTQTSLSDAGPRRASVSLPAWRRLLPQPLRSMPSGWGPMGRELVLVTPLYVLLALVFTWPLALNFHTYVLGDLEGDMWKHLWGMWWVKVNFLDQNTLPLHTHLLNYPYGGALFFIDPLNGILSTPLQLLWDAPTVYNLIVLFNIVLAAVGAWCLARYLSGNAFAAFFGGAAYGFSALMLATITSGVTEAINLGWIPFFFLFFLKTLQNNKVADAVRAGVAFGLATVGCWYYGVFCVLFAVFYYLYAVLRLYRRPLRLLSRRALQALRPPWAGPLACSAGIVLLGGFALWRLPRLLDPFRGSALDFVLVSGALLLAVPLVVRMHGGASGRTRASWSAFLKLVPGLAALAFEAWLGFSTLLALPATSRPAGVLMVAQAVFVIPAALVFLWSRREHLRALRGLLAPHLGFLVSLALAVLSSGAVLEGMKALDRPGSEWVALAALASVLFASALVLRQCRVPFPDEEGDLLADYRRFFSRRAGGLLLLALGSVPPLRLLLPEVTAVPLLASWLAGQALLHLLLLGVSALEGHASEHLRRERVHEFREVAGGFWLRMLHRPLIMALVAALLVTGPAIEFRRTINRSNSLVYRKREAADVDLYLSRRFLNVARLVDYVQPGKTNATRSYTVDKLTRNSYAGWVTLAVVALGLGAGLRRRQFRFWLFLALLFTMFSLGPFVYLSSDLYTEIRSPIYMAFFHYFPFFSQVAIPYRFAAIVMLSLGVLSALALGGLYRGRPAREQGLMTAALTLAMLFDVALFSPAPFPIPLSSVRVPEYCRSLALDTRDSGLLDIPFQRFKGELLPGEYFFYQMIHGKSIPNKVEGTIPVYVYQNPFTNYLFVLEHAQQDVPPRDRRTMEKGLEDLSRFKFRYLVVHDNLLRESARERLHALLRFYLGEPRDWPDRVRVYTVPRGLKFVDGVATSREEPAATGGGKELTAP